MARRSRIQWGPALWMTVVWILLWGQLTIGNIVGGILLSLAILLIFPLPRLAVDVTVRPWGLAILVSRFLSDMVLASVQVAWLTFRPGDPPRGMVVDLHLHGRNELLQTITAEMVALVPGTLVIDLESRSGRLTLHVLNITTRAEAERIRRAVLAQEERVLRAFDPDPQAVLDARPRRGKEPSSGGAA
ncbi:Na+/H+ antiporter subunit E [Ornithinicoccus hortensis]|uniref:Multisubunit sodium/proton antiporter MrpE subunit n=1 Tax=Ornithinicoccus hortensis TaxID=82346 RepID=A0A542YMX2_9MICO|nr:Na+/H+ antiporter subunit E [Ornithinicoccus hortensis]TQL49379.1 multisubunit sodium/proton antiporter MrpE subunit [Ornithinicoccus hortensis]